MNQAAQNGGAFDDTSVVFNVAAGGNLVDERGNIAGPANLFQPVAPFQFITDRNEVRRFVLLVQVQDDFVDAAMGVTIEVIGVQEIRDLHDGFRIDDDAPQHTAFCLNVLRQKFFHGSSPVCLF